MHERVIRIQKVHRHTRRPAVPGGELNAQPELCDTCFLLEVLQRAVDHAWDPFSDGPIAAEDTLQ